MKRLPQISFSLALLLAFSTGATACAAPTGTPPTLSALTLSPDTVRVGVTESIAARVFFEDPDGDVLEIRASIVQPGGAVADVAPIPITGVDGLRGGMLSVELAVALPAPG